MAHETLTTRAAEPRAPFQAEVLLMGKSGSGKTSMRSIIFANYIARDTRRLGATRPIFRNVEVLIYIFDVESRELEKDLTYFQNTLEQLGPTQKMRVFRNLEAQLKKRAGSLNITSFATSIWDETLYKAWSSIVYSLIPNVKVLETQLENFCRVCDADEIILFERTTFLVISHSTAVDFIKDNALKSQLTPDPQRFEKVSNIIKQFKLSCSKNQAQFQSMEVRRKGFSAFVDVLTPNTYVMVVVLIQTFNPLLR
ncbi:hypothetical protein BCR33DRAFT_846546 [Rhizoclosmatium globosum]|uniref:GTP-binding protein n=1 Tax=Rhizoclosmatium globosum TaxID=329046 RepID=A0A1Y2CVD8_9FUNG|nr:hypothetical protein BCR33DRAFT_846546 [Rhizoclosmatium globosum]|eukprot:ORY50856.1 hypothetical protein BCR33DRAFT_846546 [Rhizoclosmatium globosum]